IAKASGLMSIPDDLSSVEAAPLLCAGLTTFSALRNAPAKAGDLVAMLGIGGLGHLGVQYARHMGVEVAAISRGVDTAELARDPLLRAGHRPNRGHRGVPAVAAKRGRARLDRCCPAGRTDRGRTSAPVNLDYLHQVQSTLRPRRQVQQPAALLQRTAL